MSSLRLICAVLALVFAPLSGAFSAAHHHCHDVWHGHAQDQVAAGNDDCDSRAPNLTVSQCDQCQLSLLAMPAVVAALTPLGHHVSAAETKQSALTHHVFSLFRPPKA